MLDTSYSDSRREGRGETFDGRHGFSIVGKQLILFRLSPSFLSSLKGNFKEDAAELLMLMIIFRVEKKKESVAWKIILQYFEEFQESLKI